MSTMTALTNTLYIALEACKMVLLHGGILASAFEIFGLLCRRRIASNPELVEKRRILADDKHDRNDPVANMELADWWQFLRTVLVFLHLLLVFLVFVERGLDWEFSLTWVAVITGVLAGLVILKEIWQGVRQSVIWNPAHGKQTGELEARGQYVGLKR
ncbi:hypothetical protein LTR56_008073 [Elasticomyces elasticus]|nr:hypothetical protein LTR56_008073 [Elasticomyces elasticus]KAK3665828.1 hypothetical protein LTR22_003459 [Elasticomyces elasticus]KAK4926254.1 hypothetical protein LTR49_006726 [Elasticomyces elasticus]KAK5762010.1 hypothetical protein LTS12_007882 [Elasticomyces elasticus]